MIKHKVEILPNGEKIPKIGLGTWNMGGRTTPDYSQDSRVITAIRSGLELGYTHIDTSEFYANGHTEELIRQALPGYDRGKIFITSKVWKDSLTYHSTKTAINNSLGRLGIATLDLYLIHWPSPEMDLAGTLKAMNEAVQEGKIRHLGVSNFSIEQLQQAQDLSAAPIVTNQVPYSLKTRTYVNNGMLGYCQANQIILTAYTPIEKGQIYDPVVREIAKKHEATAVQVGLAWLIQQPKVITIPMSLDPMHLAENLGALDVELELDDISRLNQIA